MDTDEARMTIEEVREQDLGELLPLLCAYCDFYEAAPGREALLELARALIADPERHGLQLIARSGSGQAVGFATLFWTWDTLRAGEIGVMNDLYVVPGSRGAGLGGALIQACAARCRRRGALGMDWQTAPDNERAQRLYDTLGAQREEAIVYALGLGG